MKKEEFERLKAKLKEGMRLCISYRSNWRGGDGRPFDHRKGKEVSGEFEWIEHNGIKLRGRKYPINYKAIKKVIMPSSFHS